MPTEPRWATSQRAVEAALWRGPKTVQQLCEETGYSHNTVKNALGRAKTSMRFTEWPRTYVILSSFFEDEEDELPENVTPIHQEPRYVHIVKPLDIPMEDLGPRWQANARKLGQEIGEIDLEVLDLKTAIKYLEVEAASILGAIVALRSVKDGPDWREQIGLQA